MVHNAVLHVHEMSIYLSDLNLPENISTTTPSEAPLSKHTCGDKSFVASRSQTKKLCERASMRQEHLPHPALPTLRFMRLRIATIRAICIGRIKLRSEQDGLQAALASGSQQSGQSSAHCNRIHILSFPILICPSSTQQKAMAACGPTKRMGR
jgi:hypothetical protein